jgi:uncharacterized membrane protein (GlpM family)
MKKNLFRGPVSTIEECILVGCISLIVYNVFITIMLLFTQDIQWKRVLIISVGIFLRPFIILTWNKLMKNVKAKSELKS